MLEYACCYCAKTITDGMQAHAVVTADIVTGEFVQQWYAHRACFRERLHPNAQVYKPDDEDDDEWENID